MSSRPVIQLFIERACNPVLYEPDLALNLEISDLINQKKGNYPRDAAMHIVKLINHRNPHVAMLALTLLDICVKNCGFPFHYQIATKEFLNELVRKFPERPPVIPNPVHFRILGYIQEWKQTLCENSRHREDLVHINDMHQLLSYKGYMFPDVDDHSAAVLNPSQMIKSPEELEAEDRTAQEAKLQELIRRGTPADLAEANDLMKVLAGYVPEAAKPDYRKQALEELERVQRKTILLNDMLNSIKPAEKLGKDDIFEDLLQQCKAVQPKIQTLVAEEEDPDRIEQLLSLNDLINMVIKRYDDMLNGIFSSPKEVETQKQQQAISSFDNESWLIDLNDPDPPGQIMIPANPSANPSSELNKSAVQTSNNASAESPSTVSTQNKGTAIDDLLGLSFN